VFERQRGASGGGVVEQPDLAAVEAEGLVEPIGGREPVEEGADRGAVGASAQQLAEGGGRGRGGLGADGSYLYRLSLRPGTVTLPTSAGRCSRASRTPRPLGSGPAAPAGARRV